MNSTLDYYAMRDEYVALVDKVKALEQTYNCLNDQFKLRVSKKSWKRSVIPAQAEQQQQNYIVAGQLPGSFPASSNANLDNQNKFYQLDCDEELQRQKAETELQRQLMDDLRDLWEKKEQAQALAAQLKPDFKRKKQEYAESKDKLEDLLEHKECVKEQMIGFLKMYEVKKEATLLQLSHSLMQSDTFKKQHVF